MHLNIKIFCSIILKISTKAAKLFLTIEFAVEIVHVQSHKTPEAQTSDQLLLKQNHEKL